MMQTIKDWWCRFVWARPATGEGVEGNGRPTRSFVKRLIIGVVGATVILLGVAMLVFPGPGWLVIFAGLAILGTEFVWARNLLRKAKSGAGSAAKYVGVNEKWRRKLGIHQEG